MRESSKRLKTGASIAASAPRLIVGIGASDVGVDADVATRALLQLQDVMDQSLVILDSELRVQSANRRFFDYFMLSPRKTQGRQLRELAGGQWNSGPLNALLNDTLVNGVPFRNFELDRRFQHLGQRLLRLSAVRVPNEGRAVHTLFLTITDITDLRQSESVKRLEERDRTQREFISNVSHELRTPVTAIKGYAETLKRGGLDDRKNRMSFVSTIERHADRLTRLIDDLLRISTLSERPAPRLRRIRLSGLVRECVSDIAPLGTASRVSISGNIPAALTVSADRVQLVDVLRNLLTNAVKFNRPGGRVLVKARAAADEAVIVVQDTGVGISQKDLPRQFERFYRGRGARTSPGTGLGLSIAQQIVSAHGGRIWAESRRGQGASFHFTLPLWKADRITRLPGRTSSARARATVPRRRRGR